MKHWKRLTAVGVTLALGATGLEFIAATPASASTINLTCAGRTDDSTGPLGSSAAVLGTLSKITGGSSSLNLSVAVTPNVPAKVTPGSGAFDASFEFVVSLPADLIKAARDTLGLSAVKVTNGAFSVVASGAGSGNLSTTFAEKTVDLTAPAVTVTQTMSGKVTPTKAGKIDYRPGAAAMSIVIDKTVAGLQIGTLSVTCSSIDYIGSSDVQLPGAPNVAGGLTVPVWAGTLAGLPLLGSQVTPDNGNPIIPSSLAVSSQASGGFSATTSGAAFYLAPPTLGNYPVEYSVCANEKFTDPVPGVNQIQSLSMAPSTRQPSTLSLNPHPIAMKLAYEGKTTAWIQLGYTRDLAGNLKPSRIWDDPSKLDAVDKFFGFYLQPSAAVVQSALEALPNIGAGNIKVTHGAEADPYTIEFIGALAGGPHGKVEVAEGGWNTWLPADGLQKALDAVNGAPATTVPGQTTTTTAVPRTPQQILDAAGLTILTNATLQQEFAAALTSQLTSGLASPATITALTAQFPSKPQGAVTQQGLLPIPSTSTGPLCTSFTVTWQVIQKPVVQGTTTVKKSTCKKGYTLKKVRVKVRYRVKVGKRYVYKSKYVTKYVCKKK